MNNAVIGVIVVEPVLRAAADGVLGLLEICRELVQISCGPKKTLDDDGRAASAVTRPAPRCFHWDKVRNGV